MPSRPAARRALPIAAACAGLLVATYLLAAHTIALPRFEQAALRASGGPGSRLAAGLLDAITSWTVTPAVVVVGALGWRRGGPLLGAVAAGVILGSIGTADLLQHLLPLTGGGGADRSFPSGHAAVAASVGCALLLIGSARHRDRAALLASAAISAVAALTVAARWHRPTDTVGSALIALVYAAAGAALLAHGGRLRERPPNRAPQSAVPAVPAGPAVPALIAQSAVTAGVAGAAFAVSLAGPPSAVWTADAALAGGLAITVATGGLTALAMLALLGRAESRARE